MKMKFKITAIALALVSTSALAINSNTEKVLNMASDFDGRIKDAYMLDSNAVLQGYWPTAFAGENVARGWCPEFKNDPDVEYVTLGNMKGEIVANVKCGGK